LGKNSHHHLRYSLGPALKEWRGTSRRSKTLVAMVLFLLVSSTVVVGWGNYLKANQPAPTKRLTS
jgi:L-rhamnose-H+ transport protein